MSNEEKIERPSDLCIVPTRNGDVELFMSAGLRMELIQQVSSPETFLEMFTDMEVQQLLLTVVFAPRDDRGNPTDPQFNVNSVGLGTEGQEIALQWIEDHVLYFFISNAVRLKKSLMGAKMQKLTELLNGSESSQ